MSFTRPTLGELIVRSQADIDARLPGADSRLRRSTLGVLATVQSGAIHGLYGYLDYLARQILPDTADAEHLERHAGIFKMSRKPAAAAVGVATATGTNGVVIPAGVTLQRAGGVEYVTIASTTISGGVASLPVAAKKPGVGGAAPAGSKLTLVSPIAGVASQTLVAGDGLVGGADKESDASLRERVLARIRAAPAGGALHDYHRWAREMPGVTRAWVEPGWLGAGTVGIAFMMDDRDHPFPLLSDIEALESYLAEVAPVGAELVVFDPIPAPQDFVITGVSPNDDATRAAIRAELVDLFFREAEPGGGVLITHIREAISTAAGEYDHVLVSPSANITVPTAHLAVVGEIDWGI